MLPGVKVISLKRIPDERGVFSELLREDWRDLLGEDKLAQLNFSFSYPGIIRAWHRHNRGQTDYIIVLTGALKICAYDDREDSKTRGQLDEVIVNAQSLQVVRIPGFYWHGTMTLGNEPSHTVYVMTRLYDYSNPDEERRPWNDKTILDPRNKSPYEWQRSLHK